MARSRRRPRGYVTGVDADDVEQLRAKLRDDRIMILPADAEYRPLPQATPTPQDAYTLRMVMAAHQAAVQNVARLLQQGAARLVTDEEFNDPAWLREAADAERRHRDLAVAQAREAEVRAELAEAHARATGRPMPEPDELSGGAVYGPGTISADPQAGPRAARAQLRAVEAELQAAQHSERQARARLVQIDNAVAAMHRRFVRSLRQQAVAAAVLAPLAVVALAVGHPWVAAVLGALILAAIVAGAIDTCVRRRTAAWAAERRPRVSDEHDVALRHLVAAEAGVLAAGGGLVPSTLDDAVEGVAARAARKL